MGRVKGCYVNEAPDAAILYAAGVGDTHAHVSAQDRRASWKNYCEKALNRKCPSCSSNALPVTQLIVSDIQCCVCGRTVGVHWAFRAVFFVLILAATVALGLIVLIDQGLYAALLIVSLPIGAIGFVKARFCPLVVRKQQHSTEGL